jgi:TRAP-type transport system periplasmic protein
VAVYTPTAAEMAEFRSAAQPPVIEFLKTKIDPKLIDSVQAAVKQAEAKK